MSRRGEGGLPTYHHIARPEFEDFFAGVYAANQRAEDFWNPVLPDIPLPRDPTLNLGDYPNPEGLSNYDRVIADFAGRPRVNSMPYNPRPRVSTPVDDFFMVPFMTRPPPFVPPPPVDDRRQLYFRSLRNVPIRRDQSDLVRHHQRRIANSEVWVPVHSYRRRKPDIIPPPHGDEGIVL